MGNKVSRNFRVEEELYDRLPKRNKSKWIRDAIREKLERERLGETQSEIKNLSIQMKSLIEELHKIGVNINQIAHRANMDKAVSFHIDDKTTYSKLLRSLNQNAKTIISKLR